jgi:chromosome segregation ATPase
MKLKSLFLASVALAGAFTTQSSAQDIAPLPVPNGMRASSEENQRLLKQIATLNAELEKCKHEAVIESMNKSNELVALRSQLVTLEGTNKRNEDLLVIYRDYGKQLIAAQEELQSYAGKEQAWLKAVKTGELIDKNGAVNKEDYARLMSELESVNKALIEARTQVEQKTVALAELTETSHAEQAKNEASKAELTTKLTAAEKNYAQISGDRDRLQKLLDTETVKWNGFRDELKAIQVSFAKYKEKTDKVVSEQDGLINVLKGKLQGK